MKTWLRLTLVTMSVGGGFTGFLLPLHSLLHSEVHSAANTSLLLLFLVMFAFVTASGLLFVYDSKRTMPLLIALAIQIPWISNEVLVYKFSTGAHFVLNMGSPEEVGKSLYLGIDSLLGSTFSFTFNSSQEMPFRIGINLVALLMVILLIKATPKTSDAAKTPTAPADTNIEPVKPEIGQS